jgi:hypothetical protein
MVFEPQDAEEVTQEVLVTRAKHRVLRAFNQARFSRRKKAVVELRWISR